MDDYIVNRRRETAAQIMEAMTAAGLSRKEFAVKMGKSPSEVTRWLSGNHNFTSDLLAHISLVLGTDITGVATRDECNKIVDGYENIAEKKNYLNDSSSAALCPIPSISVTPAVYKSLCSLARRSGMSLAKYAERALALESSKALPEAADFAGIWTDSEYPDADEMVATLRSIRNFRGVKEL